MKKEEERKKGHERAILESKSSSRLDSRAN